MPAAAASEAEREGLGSQGGTTLPNSRWPLSHAFSHFGPLQLAQVCSGRDPQRARATCREPIDHGPLGQMPLRPRPRRPLARLPLHRPRQRAAALRSHNVVAAPPPRCLHARSAQVDDTQSGPRPMRCHGGASAGPERLSVGASLVAALWLAAALAPPVAGQTVGTRESYRQVDIAGRSGDPAPARPICVSWPREAAAALPTLQQC